MVGQQEGFKKNMYVFILIIIYYVIYIIHVVLK